MSRMSRRLAASTPRRRAFSEAMIVEPITPPKKATYACDISRHGRTDMSTPAPIVGRNSSSGMGLLGGQGSARAVYSLGRILPPRFLLAGTDVAGTSLGR